MVGAMDECCVESRVGDVVEHLCTHVDEPAGVRVVRDDHDPPYAWRHDGSSSSVDRERARQRLSCVVGQTVQA